MKRVLIGLAILLVLLLALAIAAPFFIPTDAYKDQIQRAVEDATGREFTIGGDLRVGLFPRLELEVDDVAFANVAGATESNMVTLKRLQVQLEVMPLLGGEVRVARFVLVEPTIHLAVDADGRGNWEFPTGGAAPAASDGGSSAGDAAADFLQNLSLDNVRLRRGRVTYTNARTGVVHELSDVNVALSLPSLQGPFEAQGSVTWNGKPVELEVSTKDPRALVAGTVAPVVLAAKSELVTVAYDGTVAHAAPLRVDGTVQLDVPSVRALAAWVGQPLVFGGSGFGPLRVEGTLALNDRTVAFHDAKLSLDGMNATGDLTVDAGGEVPVLRGRLDVDAVNLNPYLQAMASNAEASESGAEAGGAASGEPPTWSDAPIDASALRAVDADLTLTVGGIRAGNLKVERSAVDVHLAGGVLHARLTELHLYGGQGTGRVTVDASGDIPHVTEEFALKGIAAQPLLKDAVDVEWLEGTMQLDMSTTTSGRSQRELVEALSGAGAVKFTDGAVRKMNLAAMVRNIRTAFLDADARATQKTDFAELSGTYRMERGIVRNDDLLLLSPLLRLTGSGTVDMPARTVDYRVVPKAVGTLIGQGGEEEKAGLAVPVLIDGPWHDIRYRPDLAGIVTEALKSPTTVLEEGERTLRGLAGGLLGELGLGGAPEQVAPESPDPSGAADESEPEPVAETEPPLPVEPVEELLKLFGR